MRHQTKNQLLKAIYHPSRVGMGRLLLLKEDTCGKILPSYFRSKDGVRATMLSTFRPTFDRFGLRLKSNRGSTNDRHVLRQGSSVLSCRKPRRELASINRVPHISYQVHEIYSLLNIVWTMY